MKKIIIALIVFLSFLAIKPYAYTEYCKTYIPDTYEKTDKFYITCLYQSNLNKHSDIFYKIVYSLPIKTHSTMEYLVNYAVRNTDYKKAKDLMIEWEHVDERDKTFNSFYYVDVAYKTSKEKNDIFQKKINKFSKEKSNYRAQSIKYYKQWLSQQSNENFYQDSILFINS